MAAIYSNGGNRWNILGFNFTKRDALSSVYQISMAGRLLVHACRMSVSYPPTHPQQETWSWRNMVGGIWREGGGGGETTPRCVLSKDIHSHGAGCSSLLQVQHLI